MEKTIKLNNGYLIPTIGLGTWKSEPGKVGEAVKYAILEAGYKHIDGAVNYLNEEEIGLAYEEVFKSVKREDIFITNTILCRPPNNQPPAKDEVNNCHDRLKRLMAIMRPKVIVTIGNFATERILGRNGVTSLHGQVFEHQGIKVVPVIHPANYLYSGRNPKLLEQMKRDFQTIAAIISSAKTQKRLQEF